MMILDESKCDDLIVCIPAPSPTVPSQTGSSQTGPCPHHDYPRKKLHRRKGASVVLVLSAISLVWIILWPTTPEFVLQDTTLSELSLSQARSLTTSMQIKFSIRNPNKRIGIYYEKVRISVYYRNQKITETTELPPCFYMGHNEITARSLFLNGTVPISPYLAAVVCEDFNGNIVLNIKVSARLKWKVGTLMLGNYRLTVKWSRVFHLQQTGWVSSFDGGKVSV